MCSYTVKSHFKALSLNITSKGVLGGLINGGEGGLYMYLGGLISRINKMFWNDAIKRI